MSEGKTVIESVLREDRKFAPPAAFAKDAHVKSFADYEKMYADAAKDPEAFWADIAGSQLDWFTKWSKVLDWQPPFAKWFIGGKLNVSHNCLDRHLATKTRDKVALIWEGEPGDTRTLTYAELHHEVCKAANVLKALGVKSGDRVGIYMPLVPELAVAMLACTRIGATHSIVFGGFSAEAVRDRMNDAQAKLVITADGGYRRGSVVPLKANVDAALENGACPTVESVLVLKRTGDDVPMVAKRDRWWHDEMAKASAECPAEPVDSEHPLFILYTSGTTGKPKGVVHTTGGYLTHTVYSTKLVFDLKDDDVYWCTADIGWVTGHSYVVYGPLANGATSLMFEGAPNHPKPDRIWEIVEKYKVTILYTAPTAIRSFMKWGDHWVEKRDLSSLRLLGSVGEGINPEAWMWYHEKIGGGRCPIVDTWWQTETGGVMMSPLPGVIATKPGSCTKPLPGVVPQIVDDKGEPVAQGRGGWLVMAQPWPGMLRGIWGDDARYAETYWSKVPHKYLAGDNSRCDSDGYYWIMGRIDDVLNVSGHRLSTIEIESALVSHPAVAEAAAVGRPDAIKGEAVAVFVVVRKGEPDDALKAELKKHVRKEIGALAVPDDVRFTASLPKTRSGKIMRRLLRDIAAGKESTGDTSTLEDYTVLAKLRTDED